MKNLKFFAIVIGICIFICVVLSAYVLLNIVPVEQRVSATPIINTALPTQTSIAVSSTSTATVTTVPIATSTMDSSSGTGACVNSAEFVSDVTIPDGSNLSSDIEFVKTWRVKNTGTCTWDSRYAVVFVDETLFSSYDAFALSVTAAPGKTVDISIPMRSPIYPGTCISAWKFRAPDRSLLAYKTTA